MAKVLKLDQATYDTFVKGQKYAAVLFDAPAWDLQYGLVMAPLFE